MSEIISVEEFRKIKKKGKVVPAVKRVLVEHDGKRSMTIYLKHLSVNEAWQGRRFKSAFYKSFEKTMKLSLPKNFKVSGEEYTLKLLFGVSSMGSDWDNGIKETQDSLFAFYGLKDSRVRFGQVMKISVPKGKEFMAVTIIPFRGEDRESFLKEFSKLPTYIY